MQKVGKILFVSVIVLVIVGYVGFPTTLGFYGQMHGKQNHMMQTTTGQCPHWTENMHQEICQDSTENCLGPAHHGMMNDDEFRCGSTYDAAICNSTTR